MISATPPLPFGRPWCLAAVGIAAVAGVAVATAPSAASLSVLALASAVALVSIGADRAAVGLGTVYVAGMLLAGRSFATVGLHPAYLADVILITAACAALITAAGRHRRSDPARRMLLVIGALGFMATLRGVTAGHPDALKGAILGIYPVVAYAVARLVSSRMLVAPAIWRALWFLPAIGALANNLGLWTMVPAGNGLGLAIAGSVGVARRDRTGSAITVATMGGLLLLSAHSAKRGPVLAVVGAMAITALAARGAVRHMMPLLLTAGVIIVTIIAYAMSGPTDQHLPAVDRLTDRIGSTVQGDRGEATNNVSLRVEMWSTALKEAAGSPWLGRGAGAPLEVDFLGRTYRDTTAGPHNSFVGYAFYVGFPAALLVVIAMSVAARRAWRQRQCNWYVPAIVGSLVAVLLTAMTNVALETTYIGGLSWIVIGAALGMDSGPHEKCD